MLTFEKVLEIFAIYSAEMTISWSYYRQECRLSIDDFHHCTW